MKWSAVLLAGWLAVCEVAGLAGETLVGFSPELEGWVEVTVEGERIARIERRTGPAGGEGVYLAAGLIDTQVNGYAGVSFQDSGLDEAGVDRYQQALWAEGVTTSFPTVITNDPEVIRGNLETLAEATAGCPRRAHGLPGIFLEGPYLCPEDGYRGAHNREWIRNPDWTDFAGWQEAARGKIVLVGLAPERPGALEFIRRAKAAGVTVSLAHHQAEAGVIGAAVEAGASVSTHLGNGCANLIHRHDNVLWPQLAEDRLAVSVIADGQHLNRHQLRVFWRAKGPDNLFLVSDATELAGMPAGSYEWNGKTVVKTPEGRLEYPEQKVLAGASFPVRTGVANLVTLAGIPLREALACANANPARVFGLADRGHLAVGLAADLIRFTLEEGEMRILETWVQGERVYAAE